MNEGEGLLDGELVMEVEEAAGKSDEHFDGIVATVFIQFIVNDERDERMEEAMIVNLNFLFGLCETRLR